MSTLAGGKGQLHARPGARRRYRFRGRRDTGGSSTSRSRIAVWSDSGSRSVARIRRATSVVVSGSGVTDCRRAGAGRSRRPVRSSAVRSVAESMLASRGNALRAGRALEEAPTRPASYREFGRVVGDTSWPSSVLNRSRNRSISFSFRSSTQNAVVLLALFDLMFDLVDVGSGSTDR